MSPASLLVDRIGDTPLLSIHDLDVPARVRVLAKAEWFNPGGSVKDRAAWGIVKAAEAAGRLAPGIGLVDATSGNTGIAYAWIGAARGFPVRLFMPANASSARKRMLAAYGAEVVLTDPLAGTDGAIREARSLVAREGARWFYADQYSNEANWRAHYTGTAEEIWRQTGGAVTHFVAGVGTSGTLVGTARRLCERNPKISIAAVQPESPLHIMEGLKHLASCLVPPIYDAGAHDRVVEVTSEAAIEMVFRQARHGLLLGWSGGAALAAAERVARELEFGIVVTVLPDGGERYLDDPLWEEQR